jgi:UDP-GlcNAc3NAcA epimerase
MREIYRQLIHICTIVGARPQFIKASAISRVINEKYPGKIRESILHTGQHYDFSMSELFFKELGIPQPVKHGECGGGTQAEQTSAMLLFCEKMLLELKPDLVLVYGDTNSTMAAALVASKLHIPIAHIEAGLRSYDRQMPEEVNRLLTDHLSSLLYVPVQSGLDCLEKEGLRPGHAGKPNPLKPQVVLCGDVMLDSALHFASVSGGVLSEYGLQENKYLLCTIHRPSNADEPKRLFKIFDELKALASKLDKKPVLPLHPRTLKVLGEEGLDYMQKQGLQVIPAQGYLSMLQLEKNAFMILTDSGGVQKEAFFFQKPCVILRDTSEWTEILSSGWAVLAGDAELRVCEKALHLLQHMPEEHPAIFGDGRAAESIVAHIFQSFQ